VNRQVLWLVAGKGLNTTELEQKIANVVAGAWQDCIVDRNYPTGDWIPGRVHVQLHRTFEQAADGLERTSLRLWHGVVLLVEDVSEGGQPDGDPNHPIGIARQVVRQLVVRLEAGDEDVDSEYVENLRASEEVFGASAAFSAEAAQGHFREHDGVRAAHLGLLDKSFSRSFQQVHFAVTAGPLAHVRAWRAAAPDRIIPAHAFGDPGSPDVEEFRRLVNNRELSLFAEVSPQYQGVSIDDSMFEPYFGLAEELDIPVGVHLGEGPPGGPYWAMPNYRARLTSPLQLEQVLTRHPRLRLYVMHYGSPLVDEMIAVLYSHPQVYVDIAGNNWAHPRPHFYGQLRRLVEAGFIKRIMWGSDQLAWPRAIEVAIETIETAPFLSEEQKRDIFYNNAARFLRLSEEEMAKHHRR
jgi:predicted TIM-barrel fold metal-dependent hydrolase